MKTRRTVSPAAFVLAALALCGPAGAQSPPAAPAAEPVSRPFALRDGDRVVFYGDSITQDGGYTRFVEEYVATRFPGWDVRFYNAGVGGDTVEGGWAGKIDERLERDVVALRPTVVTVMLGMNDGRYKPYDAATFARYAEGYRSLVAALKKALPGVRLTLIRPSPYDDIARPPAFAPGYDDVLRRYGCYVGALAVREGAQDVDFRGPLNEGLAAVHALDPDLARQILPDRVHPSRAGHLVMGAVLLRAWNAPAVVTRVVLGATPPVVLSAENTDVQDLDVVEGALRWSQLDRALPLPLNFADADVQVAEEAGAAIEELDQQRLLVKGLAPGRYELTIDGASVGTFEPEELAAGVNLARRGTPMRWQAYSVRWSVGDRQEIERVRRRLLAVGHDPARDAVAAEVLAAEDEAMQRERGAGARPRPRSYELVRQ
jgi:lysophospholipase L1-like esterase